MRIIQLNLNHCAAAQDLLSQTIQEMNIDIAIVSEQYKDLQTGIWEKDSSGKAAIWSCGNLAFQETMRRPKEGFVRAKIEGLYIYSCYISPNVPLDEFETFIDTLVIDAVKYNPKIIAGDFNAWAIDWGSPSTNARGRTLLEAFSQLDLVLSNVGDIQTFRRGTTGSIVDVTFVSPSLSRNLNWNVSEHYTHSDHQAIIFSIDLVNSQTPRKLPRLTGWAQEKFDPQLFLTELTSCLERVDHTQNTQPHITEVLKKACDVSMPRRRQHSSRKPNYWWNEEIAELRRNCLKARRRLQRGQSRQDYENRRQQYHQARRELQKAIKKSKQDSFKSLCREIDLNPWGNAYRIVMARLKTRRTPQVTCPKLLKNIVEVLFPKGQPLHTTPIYTITTIDEVTEEEILESCSHIGDKKAPGLDCIPNKALKTALRAKPQVFAEVFNHCLRIGEFPEAWKRQKLVLLPKPNKQLGEPSSYRPICLLDSIGKVLERIIYNRLLPAVERLNGLSDRQYGFRKHRSTIDAINRVKRIAEEAIEGKGANKKYCMVITLDIKNAFNSAGWNHIMTTLRNLEVPNYIIRILDNYFQNRTLWYDTDGGTEFYKTSAGVPQGSVLGPLLWNIMYNDVLELKIPEEAKIIGFADDIAIVVCARFLDEVQMYANDTIRIVKTWLDKAGLELAEHKTEAVLISSRRKREILNIKVGKSEITSSPSIKYLGVMIDDRLNFKAHLNYAHKKAVVVHNALSRIMPNVGGPRQSRRTLLSRVTLSILLYGAPIWAKSIRVTSIRNILSLFRQSCLRVCCGYRTVSLEAAAVVAGIIPIDLTSDEVLRIYMAKDTNRSENPRERKLNERSTTMTNWQRRWQSTGKGRWTFRLIPSISKWISRKHGEVNFHLTQFLTGHGGYRSYLFKYGHDNSPNCPTCSITEDVEHVVFKCTRFENLRNLVENNVGGHLTPENIVDVMLDSENNWQHISSYITDINVMLRNEEKRRREQLRVNQPSDAIQI